MDLTQLANLGEFIGGVAVLVTLVYLTTQIRQNTKSVAAAATDSSSQFITAVRQAIFENAEVAHLYHVGLTDLERLDDEERLRFRLLMHNIVWALANGYKQGKLAGAPEVEIAPVLAGLERIIDTPGALWFWREFHHEYDPAFRKEVDLMVESLS